MKAILISIMLVALSFHVSGQGLDQTIPPDCSYDLLGKSYTDSVYQPTYYNGNTIAVCKGVTVKQGTDTGTIYVQPARNTAETRYPLKIGPSEIGYERPFGFSKIYQRGTTIPLDSIWVHPNLSK